MPPSPRVFISYSHDSPAHCGRVLALAQQLRRDGVDAELDQFHEAEPLHWPRWCEEQMRPENADFVLCVCTAEYAARVEGRTPAAVGKGVFWEGTLIYNELYDAKGNRRHVPVLLDGADAADIPNVLQNHTRVQLEAFGLADGGYQKLYRLLTRQAGVDMAALGSLAALPVPERLTDFGRLIDDIRAGLVNIHGDTQAIRRQQAEHSALLQRIAASARDYRPGVLRQLRRPPEHFTGRAAPLAEICAAFSRSHAPPLANSRSHAPRGNADVARYAIDPQRGSTGFPRSAWEPEERGDCLVISAVNGLGGVGKTALATMAGYALLDRFPDLQLFLELGAHSPTPRSAERVRDSLLQAVYPTARLPDDDAACWALYRSLFHDADGAVVRGLVVLDDAADDAQVDKLAPPPGCALLVTSRQRLRTGQPLRLDRLPRAESRALLQAYAPRLDDAQAGRLAALCGDLPVALKTAGGYLKAYRTTPVDEYLAELGADRLQALRNDDEPLDDINRVFDASWRRLTEAERRAWTALAVMSADFSREAGKAVIEATRLDGSPAAKTLDRLAHLNLLDYAEDSGRFGWHDLLRDYALARLSAEEQEKARLCHAEHCIGVAGQSQELYMQGHEHLLQGLALFDRERAHLEAAFGFLQADLSRAEALIRLVDCVVYIGFLRFHPRQHIRWLESQAAAARRAGDRGAEEAALGNLGNAYADSGEPRKAIDLYEQRLVIARDIGDRRGEGNALGSLGNAYYSLGEPRKAIDHYEQCLAIHREIGDRRGEGNSLGNMGLAYADLGEPRKAIDHHEQYRAIAREIGDRRGEGNALGNMGNAYYSLGEPRKAIDYYEQQLVIARDIGDRRGEGNALGNLGNAYADLGEPRKAIDHCEQQLVIAREIGDRHGEGNALWNSALDYEALGERAQALLLAQQALAIYETIEDPCAAKVRKVLAQWQGGDGAI